MKQSSISFCPSSALLHQGNKGQELAGHTMSAAGTLTCACKGCCPTRQGIGIKILKLLSLTRVQSLFFYSHGGFFYSGLCLPFKCFHSGFIAYFIRSADEVCFGSFFFFFAVWVSKLVKAATKCCAACYPRKCKKCDISATVGLVIRRP